MILFGKENVSVLGTSSHVINRWNIYVVYSMCGRKRMNRRSVWQYFLSFEYIDPYFHELLMKVWRKFDLFGFYSGKWLYTISWKTVGNLNYIHECTWAFPNDFITRNKYYFYKRLTRKMRFSNWVFWCILKLPLVDLKSIL